MSPKIKERFISFMINLLTAGVMLTIFFLSRKDTVEASVHKEIDTKASIEYVDKQDTAIREELEKGDDATIRLLESMDRKIDILLTDK